MKKFLALVRRDIAEYKTPIFYIPIVIAILLFLFTTSLAIFGKANINTNGNFSYGIDNDSNFINFNIESSGNVKVTTDKNGKIHIEEDGHKKILKDVIDNEVSNKVLKTASLSPTMIATIPILIALITTMLATTGSLITERQDKSIMFWKSMPVSDLQIISTKIFSIIFLGNISAILVSVILFYATDNVIWFALKRLGLDIFSYQQFTQSSINNYILFLLYVTSYILWLLPISGWFTFVSSFTAKSSFAIGFMPILILYFIGDNLYSVKYSIFNEPYYHITGRYLRNANGLAEIVVDNNGIIDTSKKMHHIFQTYSEPSLWIGLIIFVGFLFAAAEVRKRKIS